METSMDNMNVNFSDKLINLADESSTNGDLSHTATAKTGTEKYEAPTARSTYNDSILAVRDSTGKCQKLRGKKRIVQSI
jgi:hypothetical protein